MPRCATCMHHAYVLSTLASSCRPSGTVLQPSVQAILTFGSLQPSAVTDPKGIETLVANDLNAAVGSASLAQVTEQPMTSGQNWALNVTVLLKPDAANQVRKGDATSLPFTYTQSCCRYRCMQMQSIHC